MINIVAVPQVKDTFLYDKNLILQSTINEAQGTPWLALTCCITKAGIAYILYENVGSATSRFVGYNLNTLTAISNIEIPGTYGERLGRHSFLALNNGNLLTVNRTTHAVTEISSVDGSVVHTYGLTPNPFDGWISPDGLKLAYMVGNIMKQWDLVNDVALSDIKNFGADFIMPVWLSNGTFILYTGLFNTGSSDVIQADASGNQINDYTGYSFSGGGVRGIAASVVDDILYIYGSDDFGGGDIFSCLKFTLSTGGFLSRTIINGPIVTTFPYFDQATGFVITFDIQILNVVIDCSTSIVTITGSNFPSSPNISMQYNGVDATNFTLLTNTTTVITLMITDFQSGTYKFAVS